MHKTDFAKRKIVKCYHKNIHQNVSIVIVGEMSDPIIHITQWCTAFVRVAFISSCKFTSSFSICQPFILFRKGRVSLELHNINYYSTASRHFHVLQAHSFKIFDNSARDRKGHSHQITACRHNGLSRSIVWFDPLRQF